MNQNKLSDKDLEGYLAARNFAKKLHNDIVSNIKTGMTENEIEEIASEVFHTNDVKQHWHMPIIGVGEGSTKLRSIYALASSYLTKSLHILQENDLVLIDIAPVYNDYPADYTTSHIIGNNPELETLVTFAHDVTCKIARHINEGMAVADVFSWAKELIQKNPEYTLAFPPIISMGHRLCKIPYLWQKFPEPGLNYLLLRVSWPFLTSSNNTQMNGLWVIEPYLIYKERAAKFEVLIYVGKDTVILDTSIVSVDKL